MEGQRSLCGGTMIWMVAAAPGDRSGIGGHGHGSASGACGPLIASLAPVVRTARAIRQAPFEIIFNQALGLPRRGHLSRSRHLMTSLRIEVGRRERHDRGGGLARRRAGAALNLPEIATVSARAG